MLVFERACRPKSDTQCAHHEFLNDAMLYRWLKTGYPFDFFHCVETVSYAEVS